MASVGASPRGLPHPKKLVWRPGSQGRLGCLKSGHRCLSGVELVLGLHQECPEVVKLMIGLYHMSQGGNQGEFWDGGASMWASPCEFWW